MRLILALLAVLVVPALAVLVGSAPYLREMGVSDPVEIFNIARSCVFIPQDHPDVISTCQALEYFNWLGLTGLAVAVIGLGLIAFIAISGLISGRSRALLAGTFRNVTFISLLVMCVIMTAQAALLLGSVVLAQMYFMNSVFIYVVLIGGLMTLFIAYASVTSLFSMFKNPEARLWVCALRRARARPFVSKLKALPKS